MSANSVFIIKYEKKNSFKKNCFGVVFLDDVKRRIYFYQLYDSAWPSDEWEWMGVHERRVEITCLVS